MRKPIYLLLDIWESLVELTPLCVRKTYYTREWGLEPDFYGIYALSSDARMQRRLRVMSDDQLSAFLSEMETFRANHNPPS